MRYGRSEFSALKILEELLDRLELLEILPRLRLPKRFSREQSRRDQDTRLEDDGTVLELLNVVVLVAGVSDRQPIPRIELRLVFLDMTLTLYG